MSCDICSLLEAGKYSAVLLSQRTDALNTLILAIESEFTMLAWGVSASVGMTGETSLSFSKTDKRWQFEVITERGAIPLLHASRKLRCEAVQHFVELLEAMQLNTQIEANEIKSALEQAEAFLKEMKT